MIKISKNLQLPDDAVTQTFAFIGRKGSGKTYASGKLAEEMLEKKIQVVILDPVGNWYGLRLDRSGNPNGYKIPILGGDNGDVPLEHTAGNVVARFIVDTGSSCILDVSSFRKNQRKEFVTAFAEELFQLKKSQRSPMHLILEEAQIFAPQQPRGQERMLGAIEDIVRLGRNYGIGSSMISQRPQSVNKEILNQAEPLVVFQLVGKHERDAVKGWVVENAGEVSEMMEKLPSLYTGECFIWSPAWLRQFVKTKISKKKTFDASATPTLKGSQKAGKLIKVDLSQLQESMTKVIEKVKENDPTHLKREIIALKKQLKKPQTNNVKEQIKNAVSYRDKCWQGTLKHFYEIAKSYRDRLEKINGLIEIPEKFELNYKDLGFLDRAPINTSIVKDIQKTQNEKNSNQLSIKLGKSERLILRAFYWLKDETATKTKVAFYSGYSAGSGGFNNSLGKLRSLSLISGWKITQAGINEMVPDVDPKPTGEQLREWLKPKLGKAENNVLDVLIKHYPKRVPNWELGPYSGYTENSGGFNNALGRLRSIEAIEGYAKDGGAKASDIFFENI